MANTTFTQKSTCMSVVFKASKLDHHHPFHPFRFNSNLKLNCFSVQQQNLGLRFQKEATRKMSMVVYASIPPGKSPPANSSRGNWKVWIIGTIITTLLSFTRGKWGPLLQFKEKIETTIDEAERVADIVEEVAEGVEKVAEGVVKHLPEGKLQNAAELVEKAAENVNKHAQNAEDLLEKVEDMEKEVDSFFESTTLKDKSIVPTTDSKDQK